MKTNSPKAWLLAARPKTLTGATIPVLLGSALAWSDGSFQWLPALLCLLFACGMQVAANFINDLFDHLKGTDREDRLGPERACAQGWITPRGMKGGIALTVILSCCFGLGVLFACGLPFSSSSTLPYGGWELIALGALCVLFAFLYTTCLSYRGWGDVLVLVFFGFVPVGGTYYVQAGHLLLGTSLPLAQQAPTAWGGSPYHVLLNVLFLSLACGLVIDTLLMVNNYRDREQDALSGKQTLVVRFGEPFGRYFYLALGILAWLCCAWFLVDGKLTPLEFLYAPSAYLYLHFVTWRKLVQIRSGKALNRILGETSRNMLFFGLLMTVALCS